MSSYKPKRKVCSLTCLRRAPLFLVTPNEAGKAALDRDALLAEREQKLKIDPSREYIINGGNRGYCKDACEGSMIVLTSNVLDRVLYPEERLQRIAQSANHEDTLVTLEDRIKLLSDTLAFAVAGLGKTSLALELCKQFRWDQTCNCLISGFALVS